MSQIQFGSSQSTGRKLDVISEYLNMYQKALSQTSLSTIYIDGFAGSGEIPQGEVSASLFDDEVSTVIVGSAKRALEVHPKFDEYVFIDSRKACIDTLRSNFDEMPHSASTRFQIGDANAEITKICQDTDWKFKRGVVLLDPFGSQVSWETIETIANTQALDLWYLFPAGVGVFRQIGADGTVDDTHAPSITRLFGTEDWKTAFLKPSSQGELFGDPVRTEKVVTPESAAQFMIQRMKAVFQGGVLNEMIPLGQHAYPSYYLIFAWGNPSTKAKRLAARLSRAAIVATDRKHGRTI